jgi:hypothetical protein
MVEINNTDIRVDVFTLVNLAVTVFWDEKPCTLVKGTH